VFFWGIFRFGDFLEPPQAVVEHNPESDRGFGSLQAATRKSTQKFYGGTSIAVTAPGNVGEIQFDNSRETYR